MSDHHHGSSINWFIFGAVVGAAIGVLLAPDKGENSRKKLLKKLEDLNEKAGEIKEAVGPVWEEVSPVVEEALEEAVSSMEQPPTQPNPPEQPASLQEWAKTLGSSPKKFFKKPYQ